jgi:phage gp29-like protein
LNYGPQKAYPRLRIEETVQEDLAAFSAAVVPLIDRGFRVGQAAIRTKFSLPEPKPDEPILAPTAAKPPGDAPATEPSASTSDFKRFSGGFKRVEGPAGVVVAPQAERAPEAVSEGVSGLGSMSDRLIDESGSALDQILKRLSEMIASAKSLDELRTMALDAFPDLPDGDIVEALAMGLVSANLKGRVDVADHGDAA